MTAKPPTKQNIQKEQALSSAQLPPISLLAYWLGYNFTVLFFNSAPQIGGNLASDLCCLCFTNYLQRKQEKGHIESDENSNWLYHQCHLFILFVISSAWLGRNCIRSGFDLYSF